MEDINDSQVGYWEPAKYVAKMRALRTDHNTLILTINMNPAGHGGASGRYDSCTKTLSITLTSAPRWELTIRRARPHSILPTTAN